MFLYQDVILWPQCLTTYLLECTTKTFKLPQKYKLHQQCCLKLCRGGVFFKGFPLSERIKTFNTPNILPSFIAPCLSRVKQFTLILVQLKKKACTICSASHSRLLSHGKKKRRKKEPLVETGRKCVLPSFMLLSRPLFLSPQIYEHADSLAALSKKQNDETFKTDRRFTVCLSRQYDPRKGLCSALCIHSSEKFINIEIRGRD